MDNGKHTPVIGYYRRIEYHYSWWKDQKEMAKLDPLDTNFPRTTTREQWEKLDHDKRLSHRRETWPDSHEGRQWKAIKSLCPRCLAETSNSAYFAGPKGSAHFRGTCSLSKLQAPTPEEAEASIAEYQARKIPSASGAAWISSVDYNNAVLHQAGKVEGSYLNNLFEITDRASFEKFWGFDKVSKPKRTRAQKTLEKMGVAA